jgi:hypothetical protein
LLLAIAALTVISIADISPSAHRKIVSNIMQDIRTGKDLYDFAVERHKFTHEDAKEISDRLERLEELLDITTLNGADANMIIARLEDKKPFISFGFKLSIMLYNFVQEFHSNSKLGEELAQLVKDEQSNYKLCLRAALNAIRSNYEDLYVNDEYQKTRNLDSFKTNALQEVLNSLEQVLTHCSDMDEAREMAWNALEIIPTANELIEHSTLHTRDEL